MHYKTQQGNWDSRLRPRAPCNGATWRVTVNKSYVTDSEPLFVFGPLCENMTSSRKPEVHNILHRRQNTIEPQQRVTSTCEVQTCGDDFSETRTDRRCCRGCRERRRSDLAAGRASVNSDCTASSGVESSSTSSSRSTSNCPSGTADCAPSSVRHTAHAFPLHFSAQIYGYIRDEDFQWRRQDPVGGEVTQELSSC